MTEDEKEALQFVSGALVNIRRQHEDRAEYAKGVGSEQEAEIYRGRIEKLRIAHELLNSLLEGRATIVATESTRCTPLRTHPDRAAGRRAGVMSEIGTNKHGNRYVYPSVLMAREVEWYRKHGRYPERIVTTPGGTYPMSDRSWNAKNPDKREEVEAWMEKDGVHDLIDRGRHSPDGSRIKA